MSRPADSQPADSQPFTRTAMITGGAGAMARSIAARLRDRGYRLVLVDVDEAGLASAARDLGTCCQTRLADLADPDQIRDAAAWLEAAHADLDLLISTAGVIEPGEIDALAADELNRHVNVNLLAPMHLARAAARAMKARGSGDILAIVSMGGILALPGSAAYAASKFGLRGFLSSIRTELAPHGVRVMGVYPSGVDTPMLRHEATHGGSPLNFVGKVHSVSDVADAVDRALRTGRLETYVPYADSLSTRAVAAIPWIIERIIPSFDRLGERGRARFIAERGLQGTMETEGRTA